MRASAFPRHRVSVALFTLLALVLRLLHLGRDSLWYDETVSVYLAGQPTPELLAHTARDIHPPLYYLLLRGWLRLSGYPTGHADAAGFRLEFMAAWLSLLCGVLLVPLVWQWARRLGLGERVAALAALLLATSPLGIWYSQEVRMYTLGAVLGVGLMLAAQPFWQGNASPRRLRRAALSVAILAAAGMYTLYYFIFLLLSLNLLVLRCMAANKTSAAPQTAPHPARPASLWLLAHLGALLLYLPWLTTAWRQATDPPVPPWRAAPQLGAALVESWAALIFGQSAQPRQMWPLLLLALVLLLWGLRRHSNRRAGLTLLAAGLGPLLLILLASLWTPLYHVRYLAAFAPAWSILLALGVLALPHGRGRRRWAQPAALLLLLLGSALSLHAFWHNPAYRADDLRGATRELAQRWRPGDLIFVNAGYTYPALLVYWPEGVSWHGRLNDYAQAVAVLNDGATGAVIVQSGHLDGAADLGWGDPRSDFYALPAATAHAALRDLSEAANRLWHFRLYDTVSDPRGILRQDLSTLWTLFDDRVYSGEANLRVQGWLGMKSLIASYLPPTIATWADWLTLAVPPAALPAQVQAGTALTIPDTLWRRITPKPGSAVMLSLRLADPAGEVWAAWDEPLGGNQLDLASASQLVQPLGLTVPAATAPGEYDVLLVVYDPATGQPLPARLPDGTATQPVPLGRVAVLPANPPELQPAVANFGALRLLGASTPATMLSAGDSVPVAFTWQAAATYTPEALVVVVQALDAAGTVVASLEEEPLHGRYPSNHWQPRDVISDRHTLSLPANLPAGDYRIVVGLYRATDGQRLPLRRGLLRWGRDLAFEVSTITLRAGP